VSKKYNRRFLMLPELGYVERWKFHGVIVHPFFKNGPHLKWVSDTGRQVLINQQLFYAGMTGRL
jgi:hypothetical protein